MRSAVVLTQQFTFSAVHQLPAAAAVNCCTRHGHHYKIRVSLKAPVDPISGISFSRDELHRIIHQNVLIPLHGQFLNDHFTHSSGEIICRELQSRLSPYFPPGVLLRVSLQETRKNWFASQPSPF